MIAEVFLELLQFAILAAVIIICIKPQILKSNITNGRKRLLAGIIGIALLTFSAFITDTFDIGGKKANRARHEQLVQLRDSINITLAADMEIIDEGISRSNIDEHSYTAKLDSFKATHLHLISDICSKNNIQLDSTYAVSKDSVLRNIASQLKEHKHLVEQKCQTMWKLRPRDFIRRINQEISPLTVTLELERVKNVNGNSYERVVAVCNCTDYKAASKILKKYKDKMAANDIHVIYIGKRKYTPGRRWEKEYYYPEVIYC